MSRRRKANTALAAGMPDLYNSFKMKILIVTTGYPRDESDISGIFVERLARAMVRGGAEVTVLAPGDRDTPHRERKHGIRIVRFPYAPRSLMRLAYGVGGIPENLRRRPYLGLILPFFLGSLFLYTHRLGGDCHVIHAQWLMTGAAAWPAAKLRRKPIVVTLRGSDIRKRPSGILLRILRRMDAVATVNRRWTEILQPALGNRVLYAPNGVEVGRLSSTAPHLQSSSEIVRVLYVGTLSTTKGSDILAEAARRIYPGNPKIRFSIFGPGDPKEFGLDGTPNVQCLGLIPPRDVLGHYRDYDIFVLPSRHEGRPNALLEAMAAGLPCVATRLPGVTEVLTEECGILVPVADPKALAAAIQALAKDPDLRKRMGERAKARIAELSLDWDSCARRYLEIYDSLT